jgi:hypothetical protein
MFLNKKYSFGKKIKNARSKSLKMIKKSLLMKA